MELAVIRALCVLALVGNAISHKHYQEEIPNGDFVPHPCKPNFVWKGVGHLNQAGGGDRNQFGEDFAAAGHKWTKELCGKDSDGDGKSNGVELGDPKCIWTPNTVSELTTGITHPGVCDPYGDPECGTRNDWVKCDGDEFNCPAIKEEGVFSREIQYPYTNVPAKETSYMCMIFYLPSDGDYHMIATTPIINETRVMHHIELFACSDTAEITASPAECSMGSSECPNTIGLWTLGFPGECLYKESGVRIGTKGYKKVLMQFHWTNPEKRTDLWDASGMTLYFTSKLRNFDSGAWFTGQVYLEIPPLSPKVVQHSTCSPRCTRKTFNGSIFLTTGLNHMHYLGIAQSVKLKRSDGSELMLTDDKHYSYDTPVLHQYDPPIEIKPGDSLETVCTYKSMSREKTAFYGKGTFDEMCFGIFNYYPSNAVIINPAGCLTWKKMEFCDFSNWGCNFANIKNFSNPETRAMIDRVMGACTYLGECLHGCRHVIEDIKTNNDCFKDGRAENSLYRTLLSREDNDTVEALQFVAAMKSCDCVSENPIGYIQDATVPDIHPTDASHLTDASFQTYPSLVLLTTCILYDLF